MTSRRRPVRGGGKEALVDAAIAVLTERGVAGLTYRSVAERAGVTHGLVSHHFDSLSELLRAAFAKWTRATQRSTALEPGTGEPFDMAGGLADDVRVNGLEHLAMFELALHSVRSDDLRDEVRASYRGYTDAVGRELERSGLEPDAAARLGRVLFAAIDGLVLQQLIIGDAGALESGLAEVRRIASDLVPKATDA